jgi:type II secretory pathway component PulL
MKTFNFYQKHGNVRITLSANNFDEAEEILMDTVQGDCGWRVEDEDGEDEDDFYLFYLYFIFCLCLLVFYLVV